MQVSHPEYLLLFLVFILLFIWARRPRQWVVQPSRMQVRKSGILSRLTLALPLLCWLSVSAVLLVALAKPHTQLLSSFATVHKSILVLCVDLSTSMGSGPDSSMEKIRVVSLDFIKKRQGDAIGVTAYSGAGMRSRGVGYARILTYPTDNLEQVESILGSLQSKMFGPYTAIGDGLFMSVLALVQQDAREKMGSRYDRYLLEASMDSLGTDQENLNYAQEVIQALGPQKGKRIILFTDGTLNTGIHPAKPLWLAKRLGIKVYFVAYAVSGPTGLSAREVADNKSTLIRDVIESGGVYRESSDFEGVRSIYEDINRAEKVKFTVREEPYEVNHQLPLFLLAGALFLLWVLIENIWMKVP